jgi:hypothetical protein
MSASFQAPARFSRMNPNSRVAMTVNPSLVTLGQAKPPLQIKVVLDRFILLFTDEQARKETEHHGRHAVTDRILGRLEVIDQRLELLFPLRDVLGPGLQRRGHLRDHVHVLSDHRLPFLDFVQARLDASREPAELFRRESPFFASRFRWSDS